MACSDNRSGMSKAEMYWDALVVVEEEVSSRVAAESELGGHLSLEDKKVVPPASKGQCSGVLVISGDGDGPVFAPPKVCLFTSPSLL